ncbi:hypothetical protein [Nocardioides sp. LHG3406-4]|uniref:hypothetical protein n=1 Tax=Nocardioides sp. LHG3406-4 TaxID=2804575 RepID=UPI003CF07AC1
MKKSTLSRIAAGCGAGTLLVASLGVAGVAEAKAETCRGIEATLVGTPGLPLTGTADRDVIVSNGASVVSSLVGDDLVCVTNGTPYVDTGVGTDTVDAVGSGGAAVAAYLGQGEDRFFGGTGQDTVGTNPGGGRDDDADIILTYGGNDIVLSGSPHEPNGDTVDLGDGDDVIDFKGSEALRAGAVAGGTGNDLVYFDLSGKGDWVLNNTNGVGRRGDRNVLNWTSMEKFDLIPTEGTFQFIGSDASEMLDISDPATLTPHAAASVSLAGGDDSLTIDPETAVGSVYDGGLGSNTFVASSPGSTLSVDLTRARFDVGVPSTVGEAAVVNFQNATITALSATAKGSPLANRLLLRGCHLVGKGVKGKDYIEGASGGLACTPSAAFIGGRGHDTVIGTSGKDKLNGAKGKDRADGRKSKDKCRAEKRKSCEL